MKKIHLLFFELQLSPKFQYLCFWIMDSKKYHWCRNRLDWQLQCKDQGKICFFHTQRVMGSEQIQRHFKGTHRESFSTFWGRWSFGDDDRKLVEYNSEVLLLKCHVFPGSQCRYSLFLWARSECSHYHLYPIVELTVGTYWLISLYYWWS